VATNTPLQVFKNGAPVLEAITIPGHIEQLTAMKQPVQDGRRDHRIPKEIDPLIKTLI
jgi:hypothetical protein